MDTYVWIFLICFAGFCGGFVGTILTAGQSKCQGRAEVVNYILIVKDKSKMAVYEKLSYEESKGVVGELLNCD